jgi:tripartite-type tricarboxylate transporter receptor subunit TctC
MIRRIQPRAAGAALLLLCSVLPLHAQSYPDRPVKIIVPTVAAGTVDLVTRIMANDLGTVLGKQFFIENRGGALSIQDVIAGNLQLTFEASSPLLPHIAGGQLRALAVLSAKRIAELPDVPTIGEAGYPGVLAASWTGLFAPAGTDAAIVQKLNATINASLQTDATRQALARLGNVPKGGTPGDLTDLMIADIKKWTPIAQALHLEPQ